MSRDRRSTDADGSPMLARWGSEHPAAPLVVALHGNGTSEHSMIEISPWLPHGPVAYAAVRAPIEHGTGYCWFLRDDDDRPDPDDLTATARWLLEWLDTEGDPDRPVLLMAFRDGVTLAGTLMLTAPHRFSGAVLLYGALPFDAGIPTPPARLAGMPVFLGHGLDDTRTPAHLLARTWNWLAQESGAPLWAERVPGGDQLAGKLVGDAGTWLGDRLGEFAHLHPEDDGSLHVALPDELAYDALTKGWAMAHPLAGVRLSPGTVLVPGPRDDAELEIVAGIAAAAHRYATGRAVTVHIAEP